MQERVKSVLLLLLVLLSVYLTTRLLFGQPYLETAAKPKYEQLTFGDLKPPGEQVYPELRFWEEEACKQLSPWSLSYLPAWDALSFLLSPPELPEIVSAPSLKSGKSLEIEFPVAVDPVMWDKESSIESLNLRQIKWFEEDPQIIWYLDDAGRWWRAAAFVLPEDFAVNLSALFTQADLYRRGLPEDIISFTAADDLLLPASSPVLYFYTLTTETMDAEKLQRSIFINMAMVRKIEGRDGAVIYTDGQRALRFFPYGEFEFTAPENEPGTRVFSTTEVLRETAQYLHLSGGWPPHLYLTSIFMHVHSSAGPQQAYTHEVIFQFAQKGYPVITRTPPVRLIFSDRGTIYYNRQIRQLGGPIGVAHPLITSQQALASAARFLGERSEGLRIHSMRAVYYCEGAGSYQTLASPAWQISFTNQQSIIIDGFLGQVLAWLE